MSDTDLAPADAQEANADDTQPQAGTDGQAQAAAGSDSSSELARARADAAKYRKELREIQARLKEREDSELTATQKSEREKASAEARVAQLEAQLRDAQTQAVASRLGVKPDLVDTVSALIDWNDVDADDSKAIEKAIKELIKERPSLSGRPDGLDGGARRPREGETDMNALIRRAAGRA